MGREGEWGDPFFFAVLVSKLDSETKIKSPPGPTKAGMQSAPYLFGFGVGLGAGLVGVSQQGCFSILPLALHL